jgi:hypothetical protein
MVSYTLFPCIKYSILRLDVYNILSFLRSCDQRVILQFLLLGPEVLVSYFEKLFALLSTGYYYCE